MSKYDEKECCYQQMTKTVGGQSQQSEYHNEPWCNQYEMTRKNYDVNGLDQSGMKGNK